MFDKNTYVTRRARLAQQVGGGVLLFLGNNHVGMNYEGNEYNFRQDSSFLYFFGLDYAGLTAVMDVDAGEEIIFGDELTIDDIVWTGTMPSLSENARKVGVDKTLPLSALKEYLGKAMHQGRKIRFLPPYRADHKVRLMDLLGILPGVQSLHADEALIRAIVDLRIHKTAEEVAVIEDAVDVSTRMHLEAYRLARPGVHEAEIAAAVLQGAPNRVFPSRRRPGVPHHRDGGGPGASQPRFHPYAQGRGHLPVGRRCGERRALLRRPFFLHAGERPFHAPPGGDLPAAPAQFPGGRGPAPAGQSLPQRPPRGWWTWA